MDSKIRQKLYLYMLIKAVLIANEGIILLVLFQCLINAEMKHTAEPPKNVFAGDVVKFATLFLIYSCSWLLLMMTSVTVMSQAKRQGSIQKFLASIKTWMLTSSVFAVANLFLFMISLYLSVVEGTILAVFSILEFVVVVVLHYKVRQLLQIDWCYGVGDNLSVFNPDQEDDLESDATGRHRFAPSEAERTSESPPPSYTPPPLYQQVT